MKLKTVTVTYDFVIVVPNDHSESECRRIAEDHAQEAIRDMSVYDLEINVDDYANGAATGWSDDCIPYNGDDETTTGEYK